METLILNLYGGPGAGKSTIAAGVFNALKQEGKSVELVHEFAKDLTWEGRLKTLEFQPYVLGKQLYRIWRLLGQVDIVITDSPILLGLHYADPLTTPPGFYEMIKQYQVMWNSLDVVLKRDPKYHPYDPKGRNQTEEEAMAIDRSLVEILEDNSVIHHEVFVNWKAVMTIKQLVYIWRGWSLDG